MIQNSMITRRNFLLYSTLGLGNLAFHPFDIWNPDTDHGEIARVAIKQISVYSRPSDKSRILYQRYRDELVNIYDEIISEDGPGYNPLWYKVWRGYIHSAYLQRVKVHLNPVIDNIPIKTGQLAEVTVPFSQTMRYIPYKKTWEPLYRLYYGSTHWVKGIDPGPDEAAWYRLHDELNEVEYHAPAEHLRFIQPEEFAPISPEVDPGDKHIEVSIAQQTLTAYENDKMVFKTKVSTGIPDPGYPPGTVPTDTPTGGFHVYSKMPSKHMGDGNLTADLEAYELPGVPWTTFFAPNGVAFHGTYWHNNFGTPMSHGCVNMRTEEARWIFRWTTPVVTPETWEKTGYGTRVIVS